MNLKRFYRTLIFTGLISLVLLTLFIYSENLYNGIVSAKQFWFYGSMALLMSAFGIGLLFRRNGFKFSLNIIDISLIVFYVYYLIRAIITPYTPLIYNTRFLNFTLLFIFYFIIKSVLTDDDLINDNDRLVDVKKERNIIFPGENFVFVLICTGLVQAVWGLLQLYGFARSFHSGFKITGTFFNPAPYALYLAAIFPLALGFVLEVLEYNSINTSPKIINNPFSFLWGKVTYIISLLTVFSTILVLPATMNRASWVGAVIGSLIVFNYRYRLLDQTINYLHGAFRKLFALELVLIVIGISVTGLYFLKKGSSEGRLLIWEVTMGKITERPLFGQGVGRFEAEYNNWQADYFQSHPQEMDGLKGIVAGNTKYCFNEYLEIGSETGIAGLFLFICFIGLTIYSGFRKLKSDKVQFTGYYLYLLSAYISLIVMALVSFPFHSLSTQIVFFFYIAVISSRFKTELFQLKKLFTFSLLKYLRFIVFLILLSSSVLLLKFFRQQYKAYIIFKEATLVYQTGDYEEACKSFSKCYKPLRYTGSFLQYYGKSLYMNTEYSQSIEILEHAKLYGSDEVLYTTLGDDFKSMKRFTEAEEAYQFSSHMVPHKIYALYLQAILYDESGQAEKAIEIAERILTKQIKVESKATEEIREKMKELLKRYNNYQPILDKN